MRERLTRLDPERRETLRAELLAEIPSWYSPWLHLAFPSLVGLSILATCLFWLHDLRAWQLLAVPVAFLIINAGEWRIHRDLLHHRTPPLAVLYDRHTPQHHMIFVTDDMAMRSTREFRLVLIPFYGILAAAVAALPIPALLHYAFHQPNLAFLFMATAMGYVVGYEWLHLSYHLPSDSFIGKLKLIAILRRHHAVHHAPELMQKWNFNVTIPLWDLVRGTIYRGELQEAMTSVDEIAVRAASEAFYRAFESLSIEAMEAVWVHDDKVSCVHPGWPFTVGWPAVRQSWERVFDTMRGVRVTVSEELLDVRGDLAWMVCIERISGSSHAGAVLATNLYRREAVGWRVVLHHASTHVRAASG